MRIFKLSLATIIAHNIWIIALFAFIFIPSLLPYLTPWKADPTIIAPARAQTAWVILWLFTLFWLLYAAADLGQSLSHKGLGTYFFSQKEGDFRQISEIWAACLIFLLGMIFVAVAVTLIGAMPSKSVEKGQWIVLNIQYASLFFLTAAPLVCLSIGLASRFGTTFGYIVSLALGCYGLYGVDFLGMITKLEGSTLFDWVYILSPHFRLADLTERLVFKSGPLITGQFFMIFSYLGCFATIVVLVGYLTYTKKSKRV